MKALDDIVRDAARGTAAEISPDGVPPLHLPDSPRRGWRGTGRTSRHAGRAGRWHLAAPLAAAAAVIAVVSVAVALTGSGPARHPAPAGHQVSASPGHRTRPGQSARLDQETVDYYLPATGAQYTTGARIQTLQLTITAACTARSGFRIPRFPSWAATYTAAIYPDTSQFPDLAVISRARTLGGGSAGPLPRPAGASLRALDAAFNRCQSAVRRAFVPLDNAGRQLGNPWGTIVMRIQASARSGQRCLACARARRSTAGQPSPTARPIRRSARSPTSRAGWPRTWTAPAPAAPAVLG